MKPEQPTLMNLKDAAAYLCVSIRTMRRLTASKAVDHYRLQGSIRINRADLDTYLYRNRIKAR